MRGSFRRTGMLPSVVRRPSSVAGSGGTSPGLSHPTTPARRPSPVVRRGFGGARYRSTHPDIVSGTRRVPSAGAEKDMADGTRRVPDTLGGRHTACA